MKTKLNIIIILCCILTLSGCGFHLRNRNMLPQQLNRVSIQSNNQYGELELALKRSLITSGATITTAHESQFTIRILNSSFTHDNQNMVSSTQATIYNFNYSVSFDIINRQNKQIIKPQTVSSNRTITLNPNEVLEASGKTDIIKQELQRNIIFKIMNRIDSHATKRILLMSNKNENIR